METKEIDFQNTLTLILSNFEFYQSVKSLLQIEDFLKEHNVPEMIKYIYDIKGNGEFDDRMLSITQRNQLKCLIQSYQNTERKTTNALNFHIIPSVHKLIEELSNATNESNITMHIKNYYYKIRYSQNDDIVIRVRGCLEKQGWDWATLKLFRYPNLQLLIADLKVISFP